MIAHINGKIISNSGTELIVNTAGGIGYKIFINSTQSEFFKIGEEITILTYLVVREDALELFGFTGEGERQLFLKLLSVKGIGPKSALHILSLGEVAEISSAVARGDVDYLTKISGIGKKTAERIIVELKSQMVSFDKISGETSTQFSEAIEGLISLGYSASEAREVVKDLDKNLPTELIIKEALKKFKK